jgi:5'-nucleotidase
VLNINIPDSSLDVFDIKFTRLGKRGVPLPATKTNNAYNIGSAGKPEDDGYDTDFFAVKESKISISPLTYDLTNKEILNILNST